MLTLKGVRMPINDPEVQKLWDDYAKLMNEHHKRSIWDKFLEWFTPRWDWLMWQLGLKKYKVADLHAAFIDGQMTESQLASRIRESQYDEFVQHHQQWEYACGNDDIPADMWHRGRQLYTLISSGKLEKLVMKGKRNFVSDISHRD